MTIVRGVYELNQADHHGGVAHVTGRGGGIQTNGTMMQENMGQVRGGAIYLAGPVIAHIHATIFLHDA